MDAHPGHFVHAGEFVLVVRLMLVEDNGEVQRIINLVDAAAFNDGKVLRRGGVGDVLSMPSVRERFCTVVGRRVLGREGGPHVASILPLSIDHDVKGGW